ncbi:Pentatricopeptide repeat-containing protein [Vitis vinifera]|uniref:Pentatricopeptide repeat-containing protein n=1 Tax=Vitis vinifera TaxID=29760 RepID=A0A438IT56_VITVI|nr:Pentatricopeptide repeat-containing protein [Vitis vinifera]
MSSAYTIGHYVRTTLPRIGLEFILPSNPNISVFHSLFKSCSETKDSRWAFITFRRLLESNVKPSDLTFSLLIKAYVADASSSTVIDSPNAKIEANQIQTHLRKSGFNQYVYLTTAFLDFYGKLGCIYYAQHLFEEMPRRDVVSWNALICGYSRNGYDYDALEVFVQMLREGFPPCQRTLVGLVPSCGRPDIIFQGKAIHGFGIKSGLDLDCRVKNALTSMYAKCADLQAAEVLFEEIFEKTEVSWNTMIGAYGQNGLFDEAMLVFKQMQKERVEVNYVTIISLLSANAHLDSTHCYVIKTGFATDASVITSLVCSYAGCGNIESAGLLYNLMPQRNLVSLTAMISGYAEKGNMDPTFIGSGLGIHAYGLKTGLCADCLVVNGLISMYSKFGDIETVGRTSDAMELFCQMRMYGHSPDAITIASLLAGCSEVGFLQFGERLHNYVLRNNLDMEDFLETALVDMYIKCGRLESAERVFKSIKEPCLATWNTMIQAMDYLGMNIELSVVTLKCKNKD